MKKLLKAVVLSIFLSFPLANAFAGPVNINTADAKTLAAELKGVGPKSADAIVAYRSKHGPFKTVDGLSKVKGIGVKTIDKNRDKMTVDPTKK
ncbi:MAG: hypothetical protein BMS9Abin22_494 [Gammaproteobacteria bacterium]|nr:MAG: hypothetical protein BMS9Abin22_494 [Gammaproteobacteria bacterium]